MSGNIRTNLSGLTVIFALGAFLGILHQCIWPLSFCNCRPAIQSSDTTESVSYVYDSSAHEIVPVEDPEPASIVFLPVPADIDSQAVTMDYFASRFYSREYRDSNIVATVSDSVSRNKISWGSFEYKLLVPTKIVERTITNTVYPNTWYAKVNFFAQNANNVTQNANFGIGAGAGYRYHGHGIDLSLNYLSGSGRIFQLSYSKDLWKK